MTSKNYIYNDPISKYNPFLRYWGLEPQQMNFEDEGAQLNPGHLVREQSPAQYQPYPVILSEEPLTQELLRSNIKSFFGVCRKALIFSTATTSNKIK